MPNISFDYDYIEVTNDRYFKLSSRQFVACPFKKSDYGIVSPRCYQNYVLGTKSDGGYFAKSVENSFPELGDRVRFLNKFYQCLLCYQLPHKARKLVVVGDRDSGKSSWANVLFGLIDRSKIAVLTKEQNFGASMIKDDTELLYVDEWTDKMMTPDLLKTLLQGGYFAQSVKHQSPQMQEMNAGVFITCNNVPSFGDEQENVDRRLAIFHTRPLQNKCTEAPQWMKQHAMDCLIWMVNVINSNEKQLESDERFYELPFNVKAETRPETSMIGTHDIQNMKKFKVWCPVITPSPAVNDAELHKNFAHVANTATKRSK